MNNMFYGTILILAGMAGIYFKIEYSGWIIFIGAIMVL